MILADLSLRRPVTTVVATLTLVPLGNLSLRRLPAVFVRDDSFPALTVRSAHPGAAAEVSRLVAEPIEEAVAAPSNPLYADSVAPFSPKHPRTSTA